MSKEPIEELNWIGAKMELAALQPDVPMNQWIEVIVRYEGQEFVMTRGTVTGVDLQREIVDFPSTLDDPYGRFELGREETLTIRVRR